MESILERYLRSYYSNEAISVDFYNIDGATCEVRFYTDEYMDNRIGMNINVWEMLAFFKFMKMRILSVKQLTPIELDGYKSCYKY